MGRRGRTSAAALALVSTPRKLGDLRRPPPLADLTAEQADEWTEIVARCPADWFPRETYPLLAQYVRHVVSARWLSKLRDRLERARRFDVDAYERVSKLIGRETQLLASLATKMRLSQHATYAKEKTKGPTIPSPWED
jgi:hypothetical protein